MSFGCETQGVEGNTKGLIFIQWLANHNAVVSPDVRWNTHVSMRRRRKRNKGKLAVVAPMLVLLPFPRKPVNGSTSGRKRDRSAILNFTVNPGIEIEILLQNFQRFFFWVWHRVLIVLVNIFVRAGVYACVVCVK